MERAQSSPEAGTEQSGISSDERAGAARQFQLPYRLEKSPANGGAEAIAARGGDGANLQINVKAQEAFF